MSMRGRIPRPVQERIREGATRHLPEPVMICGRPMPNELSTPPEHLPKSGKEFWLEIVPALAEVGLIDRIDSPLLEMLAVQWARRVQAGRVIASEGLFGLGSRGQIREHPAVKIEREATIAFERISQSFGLSPVGRVRLGLAELARRQMAVELEEVLGPKFDAEADVVSDDDITGLPGAA